LKRLFIALTIPTDISADLKRIQHGIRGATWVTPHNFHLTLCFIGTVNNGITEEIIEALENIRVARFFLQLCGVNHFSRKGEIRSLWVGVLSNSTLTLLQKKIVTTLIRSDFPFDKREFRPHVTLAKLKNASVDDIAFYEKSNNLFSTRVFTINAFTIFESIIKGGGPIYIPIAEIPMMYEV
tara:strand:- start:936 stop:1481 length:546 start_codon:yes stop_codon:yes gene_type:complete